MPAACWEPYPSRSWSLSDRSAPDLSTTLKRRVCPVRCSACAVEAASQASPPSLWMCKGTHERADLRRHASYHAPFCIVKGLHSRSRRLEYAGYRLLGPSEVSTLDADCPRLLRHPFALARPRAGATQFPPLVVFPLMCWCVQSKAADSPHVVYQPANLAAHAKHALQDAVSGAFLGTGVGNCTPQWRKRPPCTPQRLGWIRSPGEECVHARIEFDSPRREDGC